MKISIIVPCYNEEKSLRLLAKEFDHKLIANVKEDCEIEVIFVNNGSNDNSQNMIEELMKEYNFLKTVRVNINQGYGYGILQGLNNATGDYLGWIHADLQFNPAEIAKGVEILRENKYPKNVFIKGLRKSRPLSDKFFTFCMAIYETILLHKSFWDINAQPTLISRDLYEHWKEPPWDFSLDLYAYYVAKLEGSRIFRYKVLQHKRKEGVSSWNHGLKSRINLIKRVRKYSKELKRRV